MNTNIQLKELNTSGFELIETQFDNTPEFRHKIVKSAIKPIIEQLDNISLLRLYLDQNNCNDSLVTLSRGLFSQSPSIGKIKILEIASNPTVSVANCADMKNAIKGLCKRGIISIISQEWNLLRRCLDSISTEMILRLDSSIEDSIKQIAKCHENGNTLVILAPTSWKIDINETDTNFKNIIIHYVDCNNSVYSFCSDLPIGSLQIKQMCMLPTDDPHNKKRYAWVIYEELGFGINPNKKILKHELI